MVGSMTPSARVKAHSASRHEVLGGAPQGNDTRSGPSNRALAEGSVIAPRPEYLGSAETGSRQAHGPGIK